MTISYMANRVISARLFDFKGRVPLTNGNGERRKIVDGDNQGAKKSTTTTPHSFELKQTYTYTHTHASIVCTNGAKSVTSLYLGLACTGRSVPDKRDSIT